MLYLITIYKPTTPLLKGDHVWEADNQNRYERRWRSKYYNHVIYSNLGFRKITYQQLQQIIASASLFTQRLNKIQKKGKK